MLRLLVVAALLVTAFVSGPPSALAATTLFVTTTADSNDGVCDIDCSLREALTVANSSADADAISFAIPGPGPHTITPTSALPAIEDPVTIDGYTQPGALARTLSTPPSLKIQLDGSTAGGSGLTIAVGGVVIRGLSITRFGAGISLGSLFGTTPGGTTIAGNLIGLDPTGAAAGNVSGVFVVNTTLNTIGGTAPADGNVISANVGLNASEGGLVFYGATNDNLIQGNLIGTDAAGTSAMGNFGPGLKLMIGASRNVVGGTAAGARNVISGNGRAGIDIPSGDGVSRDNVIHGNYIGTDVTGAADVGNDGDGIAINGGAPTRTVISDNVISGNGKIVSNGQGCVCASGISLTSGTTANTIIGNLIGTAADGTSPLPNAAHGIILTNGAADNTIGGTGAGQRNVIAHNGYFSRSYGVFLEASANGNAVLSNSIFENHELGINLAGDGVTANDAGDADLGPNGLQNFPVLTSAETAGGSTAISGELSSEPNADYRLEFFASSSCDESGFGEGARFLGTQFVTTNETGSAPFSATVAPTISAAEAVTATATDSANNTSEFSACVPGVVLASADLSLTKSDAPDPVAAGSELTYTLTTANVGPNAAADVTITDTLPAAASFVSASASQGSCSGTSTVTCSLGSVASGASATVTIVVRPTSAGDLSNTATVSSTTADPGSGNNSATTTTVVTAPPPSAAADLSLTKSDTPDPIVAGEALTYTLRVANAGPGAASEVTVTDALPATTTFVSASASQGSCSGTSTVTCALDVLGAGADATVTIVVRPASAGTVSNTADVSSSTADPNASNNSAAATTTVTAPPPGDADLAAGIDASPKPVTAGEELTFSATARNAGPARATGVSLTLDPPAGAPRTSLRASQGTCAGEAPIVCDLGALDAGTGATVTLVVRPRRAGTATAAAQVRAAQPDPDESNQRASVSVETTCATSFVLDAVTVLADCIREDGSTYIAEGNTRFANGARIVTDGTDVSAPLVIDPAAHTIGLQPQAGSPRTGLLYAGSRKVASGRLVVKTQVVTDPATGLAGLARVEGLTNVQLRLSGWALADATAALLDKISLYLAPVGIGGGALVNGELSVPFYVTTVTGAVSVQARGDGVRVVRSGAIRLPSFQLPRSPWKVKDVELLFLEGGDRFRGKGTFDSPFFGNLKLDPVIVTQGKLSSFTATYDGTCQTCDPSIGEGVLKLKHARVSGYNLDSVDYSPPVPKGKGPSDPVIVRCPESGCPKPPHIKGNVVMTAFDRVVGLADFRYDLSGEVRAHGHIFFAPAIPSGFAFPSQAAGIAPYADFLRHSQDFAEATLHFTPPHRFTISGYWTIDQTGFLRANFAIGYDPPYFTGRGGVELRVPNSSPIFPGKRIASAEGLVSDKAAAGQTRLRVCAPKWLGGGCITYFVGVAFLWKDLRFQFGHNISDYSTVDTGSSYRAVASASSAGAAPSEFVMPAGRDFVAIRVRSVTGVPSVRLTSPSVNGNRYELTLPGSDDLGNQTGALAYAVPKRHEVVFVVAKPPAGEWNVTRLRGPAISRVEVGRGLAAPELRPAAKDLRSQTLRSTQRVRLHYKTVGAGPSATVDLWASRSKSGAGAIAIAQGLPASGATAWSLRGVRTGRYYVFGILNRNGVPFTTRYWQGWVDVVDAAAPRVPQNVTARATVTGARVLWRPVAKALGYVVTARPIPRSVGRATTFNVSAPSSGAILRLRAGRRYLISVYTFDRAGRRSAESPARRVTVRGRGKRSPMLAGLPPRIAQVGESWVFTPQLSELGGGSVAVRLVSGPYGMKVTGNRVVWKPGPRAAGSRRYTLEAYNTSGGRTRRTFEVRVFESWSEAPATAVP